MDVARVLAGGDRRSIGRSHQVVSHVLKNKDALPSLIAAMASDDAVVRVRAADALEKVSARNPRWLDVFATRLIAVAKDSGDKEVRWHAAQILPRLLLTTAQRRKVVALLFDCLGDDSRIVQAFALTGLVELSKEDPALAARVAPLVRRALRSPAPSVRARAKALLNRVGDPEKPSGN